MRKWMIAGLAAVLLLGAAAGGWAWWRLRPFALPEGANLEGRPAPAFALTDQFGKPLALADLRGRVVLLTFIDSHCTDVCEFTATELLKAQTALGAQRGQVSIVAVNVNARYNSVGDVLDYSRRFHMDERWYFLTGDATALQQVWKDYYIGVEVGPRGDVTHQVAVYVIDQRGRQRALLLPHTDPMIRFEQILADVRPLL